MNRIRSAPASPSYLGYVRKFALDALTDARTAPESVRREAEAAYQRADADYRRAMGKEYRAERERRRA